MFWPKRSPESDVASLRAASYNERGHIIGYGMLHLIVHKLPFPSDQWFSASLDKIYTALLTKTGDSWRAGQNVLARGGRRQPEYAPPRDFLALSGPNLGLRRLRQ